MEKPFSTLMASALYGPAGYYTANVRIGRTGDFYTAASASPLFAAVLGSYVTAAWRAFGEPLDLQILEFGGGQGELAERLLLLLLAQLPGIRIHYRIRELSPRLQAAQAEAVTRVAPHAGVALHRQLSAELPTVMIGNELLDAFPVDLVRRTNHGWLQAYLREQGEPVLVWREAQPEAAEFADRFVDCPVDGMAEVCSGYASFFKEAYEAVHRARLLLFDYGITTAEWRSGVRLQGTIRGYRQHELVSLDELIGQSGQADITADVNWDAAYAAARTAGWHVQPLVTQGKFLMRHDIINLAEQQMAALDHTAQRKLTNAIKHLVLPGGMGERFQVMECHKTGRVVTC